MKAQNRQFRSLHDIMMEKLQNSKYAAEYLAYALETYKSDSDAEALIRNILLVEEAQGGVFGLKKLVESLKKKSPTKKRTAKAKAGA